jgi:hypothetical protein
LYYLYKDTNVSPGIYSLVFGNPGIEFITTLAEEDEKDAIAEITAGFEVV